MGNVRWCSFGKCSRVLCIFGRTNDNDDVDQNCFAVFISNLFAAFISIYILKSPFWKHSLIRIVTTLVNNFEYSAPHSLDDAIKIVRFFGLARELGCPFQLNGEMFWFEWSVSIGNWQEANVNYDLRKEPDRICIFIIRYTNRIFKTIISDELRFVLLSLNFRLFPWNIKRNMKSFSMHECIQQFAFGIVNQTFGIFGENNSFLCGRYVIISH